MPLLHFTGLIGMADKICNAVAHGPTSEVKAWLAKKENLAHINDADEVHKRITMFTPYGYYIPTFLVVI
jgi:hypothetical protein